MNYEAVVSWLMQSDWLFLAFWVVALVAAFALAFPEPTHATVSSRRPTETGPRRS